MPFMKKSKRIHHLSDAEFSELRAGAEEALAHAQGKKVTLRTRSVLRRQRPLAFTPSRIRSIRRRLNVSQPGFAELLYVTKATASKWEQGFAEAVRLGATVARNRRETAQCSGAGLNPVRGKTTQSPVVRP
jgi:DNA-binding transcriptional regulator YiaG